MPLYSLSVVVPNTGHLFEVVSEHLSDDEKMKNPFDPFPPKVEDDERVDREANAKRSEKD